jgi:HNH endonuclease
MSELTAEVVRDLLAYDPDTGVLRWLPRKNSHFNGRFADKPAFTAIDGKGYHHGSLLRQSHRAHRVAWLVHYGVWPSGEIDHIDGDRTNNRISNLRDVSRTENGKNLRRRSDNVSGSVGVWFDVRRQKFTAQIKVGADRKHLGYFETLNAAIAARKVAEVESGYHANHGRAA